MEAAIALAHQAGTSVTVVYRGQDHRRGRRRNIEEFGRLVRAGRIDMRWQAEITVIDEQSLTIRVQGGTDRLGFDAVLVMIGSLPPWEFLSAAGVQRGAGILA